MLTSELLDYIRHQLQQGVSREDAKLSLISRGWQMSDIDDAFNALNPISQPLSPTRLKANGGFFAKPYLVYIGGTALLMNLLWIYLYWRSIHPAIAFWFTVYIFLVSILSVFALTGLAKLFKAEGQILKKALIFTGLTTLVFSIYGVVASYLPDFLSWLTFLLLFTAAFIFLAKLYNFTWIRTLALGATNSIVLLIIIFVMGFVFLLAGAFSIFQLLQEGAESPAAMNTPVSLPGNNEQLPNSTPISSSQSSLSESESISKTAPSNKQKHFSCKKIATAKYTGQLEDKQWFAIGWGDFPPLGESYGTYFSSGWQSNPFDNKQNESLEPIVINPYYPFNETRYSGGVLSIECNDGQKVSAYIPDFANIQGARIGDNDFMTTDGKKFRGFFVAGDGSTYFDKNLTNLARPAR